MITFEMSGDSENPVFGDVDENQFFVSKDGELCQKYDRYSYHVIAKACGVPVSYRETEKRHDLAIKKILPHVTKINFPAE